MPVGHDVVSVKKLKVELATEFVPQQILLVLKVPKLQLLLFEP